MSVEVKNLKNLFEEASKLEISNFEEAAKLYSEILKRDPQYSEARYRLAVLYYDKKDIKVLTLAEELINSDTLNTKYLKLIGKACVNSNLLLQAFSSFYKANKLDPNDIEVLNEMALICLRQKENELALQYIQKILEKDTNNIQARLARCQIYFLTHQYSKLLNDAQECLQLSSGQPNSNVFGMLGTAWMELGNYKEAKNYLEKAIELNSKTICWHINLGIVYLSLQDEEKALEKAEDSLKIDSKAASAWDLKGVVYLRKGDLEEAKNCFDSAIYYEPTNPMFHENRSYVYLALGNYEVGFSENIYRYQNIQKQIIQQFKTIKTWQRENLNDKILLITAEQGFGDCIQFVRYLYLLKEAYPQSKIYLLTYNSLFNLFEYNLKKIATVILNKAECPSYDFFTTLMCLPQQFRTRINNIPQKIPYLDVSPSLIDFWKNKLITSGKLKVGVAWSGRSGFYHDHLRSIPFDVFKKIFEASDVEFISLQIDYRLGDKEKLSSYKVYDFSQDIKNFEDTAAIIKNLDLIISSDTSVIHLVGALGKPGWILLQYSPDWRWVGHGENSPWYPTLKLFQQKRFKEWATIIDSICIELDKYVSSLFSDK